MRALIAALVLTLSALPLRAAEIVAGGDSYMGCIATLRGTILSEDNRALDDLLDEMAYARGSAGRLERYLATEPSPFDGTRLCLDSPGGNFGEAMEIGAILRDWEMGTAIARGARCESACAVIFLAGSQRVGAAGTRAPDRLLHAGGILGVHAPALSVPERSYTQAQVAQAYALAIETMAQLAARKSSWQIGDWLLFTMLRTPPDDMARLETVFDAATWEIPVVGTVLPEALSPLVAANACTKALARAALSDPAFAGMPPLDRFSFFGASPVRDDGPAGPAIVLDVYGEGDDRVPCRLQLAPGTPDPARARNPQASDHAHWATLRLGSGPARGIAPALLFDSALTLAAIVAPEDGALARVDIATLTPPRHDFEIGAECSSWQGGTPVARFACESRLRRYPRPDLSGYEIHDVRFGTDGHTVIRRDDLDSPEATVNGIPARRVDKADNPPAGDHAICYRRADEDAHFCVRMILPEITLPAGNDP